uniref:F-box only protein 41-like n=1 Tax=Stegastes partitus TaxID=144197 RepID=A0A3B5BD81_9TELE
MSSYSCPRCGDQRRFSSVPELRAHLVSRHTYETLLLLSQNRRSAPPPRPGRGPDSALLSGPRAPRPPPAAGLPGSSSVVGLRPAVGVPLGLPVGIGLEERLGLGLDRRIARTFAEVEERVNRRVGRLRAELQRREAELEQERRDGERLRGEKMEVEEKAAYLSRQVSAAVEMMERLKTELEGKEEELHERHQSVPEGSLFMSGGRSLSQTAGGRCSLWLQVFIETLLDRADRAERQLLLLDSHHNHFSDQYVDPYDLTEAYAPAAAGRGGRSLDSSSFTIKAFLPPDAPSSLHSTPSNRRGNRQLGADTLRLRAGLFCVFPYLDVRSLLRAAEVCSDWRFVARHPAVWTRLRLENARVSAEFLTTLSQWCTQTQSVTLNNLKPRSRRADETREDYHRNTRGSVEPGVEALLRSAGGSLLHLSISQCPHILTDRTLWLASCYCRNLHTLTYRSSSDPLGQEVLWALGAGCRSISSLQVAPAHPCQQPTRFGNRCLQTIGRCWPHLRSLSVGGAGCGTQGLVTVVRNCAHLQVLELERITDLGLQAATELCKAGLKSLQTLVLTHTPVSGQAILHFHSVCDNIRSIEVEVSAADYFEEPDTQEAQHLFGEILSTLKVLQKRPGLSDVLQVKAEGFF